MLPSIDSALKVALEKYYFQDLLSIRKCIFIGMKDDFGLDGRGLKNNFWVDQI